VDSPESARALGGDPDKTLPKDWAQVDAQYKTQGPDWNYAPGANAAMSLREMVEKKLMTYPPAIRKALESEMAGVLAGLATIKAADNAGVKTPKRFVEAALNDPRTKQPVLALGSVSEEAAARAAATAGGISIAGKIAALDHDGMIHTLRQHGGKNERLRGQEPIAQADLARFGEILNAATFAPGNPPVARDGSKLIQGSAVLGEFEYGFIARVRKKHVVPQSLWKRLRK
jgi:hypothetical protein